MQRTLSRLKIIRATPIGPVRLAVFQTLLVTGVIFLFVWYGFSRWSANTLAEFRSQNHAKMINLVQVARHAVEPIIADVRAGEITAEQGRVEATALISQMTYEDDFGPNYIFMSSYEGVMLVQPYSPELVGTNQIDLQDSQGLYIIRELIASAITKPEGGFVTYHFYPPDSNTAELKESYVIGVPELRVYIGTGMYMGHFIKGVERTLRNARSVTAGFILLMACGSLFSLWQLRQRQQAVNREARERAAAEQALAESERNMRMVFNTGYDALFIHDTREKIITINDRAREMYQIPVDRTVGLSILDLSDRLENQKQDYREIWEHVLDGEEFLFEWSARKFNSEEVFPVEVALRPITWYGEPCLLAVVRDITERSRVQKELLDNQKFLEHSQALAHVGHYVFDKRTRTIAWSKEMYQIYGWPTDRPAPMFIDQKPLLPPEDWKRISSILVRSSTDGSTAEAEYRIYRNGEVRHLHAIIDWGRDETGEVVTQFGSIQDITDQVRARQRIRAELEKMEGLREVDTCIIDHKDLSDTLQVIAHQAQRHLHIDGLRLTVHNGGPHELHIPASGRNGGSSTPCHPIVLPFEGGMLAVESYPADQVDDEWRSYLETLADRAAIAVEQYQLFHDLRRSNADLRSAYEATIAGWSRALELRDKETQGHSDRVTMLSVRLAERLGFSAEEIVHFRRGVLLHDIGKMGIPDHILFKPGKLDEDEWQIMRQHPDYARDMLAEIDYLRPALDVPYCHHERWDGSGYPRGLKGDHIPLGARIFAVVDVWDALCSDRPYRSGWPMPKVMDYIRENAGHEFDPAVVDEFLAMITSDEQIATSFGD